MRWKLLCLLASAGCVAGPAWAEMTLSDALIRAYRESPTLRADREGLKVLDEDVAAAKSAGRPTLVGEGNITRSEIDVVGTGGVVGARLSQPLFRGFRVKHNVDAAQSNVLAGRESLRQSEIGLLTDVVEAYSAVLRDQEILSLNRAMIDILGAVRAAEQRRLDLGERTRTDVSQAEARLSGMTASVSRSEQRLAESSARFRSLVGIDPADLAPLPPLPSLPASRDAAVDYALDNSPRIRQAMQAAKVADSQVKAAKGLLLPSLDAVASVNHRDEIVQIINRKINQDYATFALTLTVPFYQGGSEYAAVRRAKHTAAVREHEIEETTRDVYADVNIAWDRTVAAGKAKTALQEAIRANETAVAGVRREALGGSRTTLDILDAERELRDAKVEHVTALQEEYIASFRLLAALGKATVTDLGLEVAPYDPNQHYRKTADRWIGFGP